MDAIVREDIVFVGDVHLGRRPVGLDAALEELQLRPGQLSPAEALARTVQHLLDEPPRAVVFAGDLVDQDDDAFEAFAILEREVQRLERAGIPVFAIAGNHDGLVLPKLVARVPGVQLLGEGGRWQRVELPAHSSTSRAVDLVGWSFPSKHFATCPLDHGGFEEALADRRSGALVLGVLHGDLDAGSSSYGPVPRRRLEQAGLDGWFLGHVHQPGDLSAERPIGYLGSLVGMDPGETGRRGAWRVTPTAGSLRARQLELGPIRWEHLEVDLQADQAADSFTLHAHLQAEVERQLAEDPTFDASHHRLIVVRANFTGRLAERAGVRKLVQDCRETPIRFQGAGTNVLVQRLYDRTRDAVDLDELAQDRSPIGHVAARLVQLRDGRAEELIATATQVVQGVDAGGWRVDDEDYPLPTTAELLERAAWRVLDQLLEQRSQAGLG
ncbi:MAG: metallophosphoesterase [Planctomycetota bacterium]|nr:metallophosphoesterase [Planctomycetota bacterium]